MILYNFVQCHYLVDKASLVAWYKMGGEQFGLRYWRPGFDI